jgi:hypothetical protein
MPGFICLTPQCSARTFRRPPNNYCDSCRSCRRGRRLLLPVTRFTKKSRATSLGKPAKEPRRLQAATIQKIQQTPEPKQRSTAAQSEQLAGASGSDAPLGPAEQPVPERPSRSARTPERQSAFLVPSESELRDYNSLREQLDAHMPGLIRLVGRKGAHGALAVCHCYVDRFASGRLTLPAWKHDSAAGLIGIGLALSSAEELKDQRIRWHMYCREENICSSVRKSECVWLMSLPVSHCLNAEDDSVLPADLMPSIPELAS